MQEIYEKAEELGALIVKSDPYRELRRAEKAVEASADVKEVVDKFNKCAEKIAEKEKKQQPIEVDEKHELQELREQVQSNELLQELLRVQTEYAMMMNKINSILSAGLERREDVEGNV